MAEGVYDAAKEVARTHIVKGFGSDSKDFEFFLHVQAMRHHWEMFSKGVAWFLFWEIDFARRYAWEESKVGKGWGILE